MSNRSVQLQTLLMHLVRKSYSNSELNIIQNGNANERDAYIGGLGAYERP